MKNKNIPALITLCAGAIASITCILNNYPLIETLWVVLVILFIFYVIGVIVGKVIGKINKEAQEAYAFSERERMKAEKEASKVNEQVETLDTAAEDSVTSTKDM
jgi:flagellar biosynthesis/type III secretory pathway M-ring protein FliF/YscJ